VSYSDGSPVGGVIPAADGRCKTTVLRNSNHRGYHYKTTGGCKTTTEPGEYTVQNAAIYC